MVGLLDRRYQANLKIFVAKGANPLADWQIAGTVRRKRSPDGDGFVYAMHEGSPATRITLPRKGAAPLDLRHRRLLIELWGDPLLPFAIDVTVRDSGGITRTLTLSRDCAAPELKHGSPKAKLPLRPALSDGPLEAGWRIVDLELPTLIPRAFDGAAYARLDGLAILGVCELRAVEVRAESPPAFAVKNAVPLLPIFDATPRIGAAAVATDASVVTADDDDDSMLYSASDGGFMRPAERAAAVAAAELRAFEEAKAAAKAAQLEYLQNGPEVSLRAQIASLGDEPRAFIPVDEEEGTPARPQPSKWRSAGVQAAVQRLAMLQYMTDAPRKPRRTDDPRAHATDGGLRTDASAYRREKPLSGTIVSDATASVRRGVTTAKELCNALRRGDAGASANLAGVAIGEGGARLLSFALAADRASTLQGLCLWRSDIGDGGARQLASALRVNFALTAVDLRRCGIEEAGGVALAGALETGCAALRSLLLGRNELGPRGVGSIVLAVVHHARLAHLDLEHTAAARGVTPLFRAGDEVRASHNVCMPGRLVHQGSRLQRTSTTRRTRSRI